jgi:hypothetical protein
MDPPDPQIFQTIRTGTEVSEMVLTFREGLELLGQHEHGRSVLDGDYDRDLPLVWQRVRNGTVSDGRANSAAAALDSG